MNRTRCLAIVVVLVLTSLLVTSSAVAGKHAGKKWGMARVIS